ncbi:hypothetical protein BX616_004219 [Lobosporangium transversale]|uniref:Chitin-binding type-4 domain-containing protein n=1 Tax=Lobosporangium transversale TaxID=64571 RepID=A0A1Y2GWP4_9FUNG|nr:hypothetical protein BCR41DRAFT_347813 [Lobosporangium transversale]KAF9898305.1 hypothetical protein BX616_004219 [Lobosporangium transversale]ORZ26718.1 hypothetical protein BCR41DRAFT_347813 [Lobosporangium transversale]|eukprot:XP_021884481.1 hypothetical protein BCR41DRAFT_347813 [Lobosporangium transversale]
MMFSTLSKASIALIAASLLLMLTQSAESHSWVDCVDWRFNDPKNKSWGNKNGKCFGYARRFPYEVAQKKGFNKLDSDSPNRHYQQRHRNPRSENELACSDGKIGEERGADETMSSPVTAAYNGVDRKGRKTGPMTRVKVGGQLCVRWPAKNHAVKSEKNRPVTIGFSRKPNPKKDPTQKEFLDNKIAELNYKNCTETNGNTDGWPCGGCFPITEDIKPGYHVMQWRWQLNSDEYYTSCADVLVQPK